jgi:hypothetical protein
MLKGLTKRRKRKGDIIPFDGSPYESIKIDQDAFYEYNLPNRDDNESELGDDDANGVVPEAIMVETDEYSPVSSDGFLKADVVGTEDACCIPGVYTNCRMCTDESRMPALVEVRKNHTVEKSDAKRINEVNEKRLKKQEKECENKVII